MYESYWQLKHRPFENAADPRFYYPAESHQAALLKLRYAIESRHGAALLAGPSGSGKTLLTGMLPGVIGESFTPLVRIVFPQMSSDELLAYLADQFDGDGPITTAANVQLSVRRIERFLAANHGRGHHAIVVVDEAHLIDSPRTFEALRLLLNFEPGGSPALTLVLVGEPAILPILDRLPQWEERLDVKCLLKPLSEAETAAYVEHRLRVAGATRPIIDVEALPTLHALTQGIARRINRLCDLALLVGFAEERTTLDASHFEAVCQELVTVVPE